MIRMSVQLITFYIKDDLVINDDHLHCSLPGTNAIDPLWERPLVDVAQLESVTEKHQSIKNEALSYIHSLWTLLG